MQKIELDGELFLLQFGGNLEREKLLFYEGTENNVQEVKLLYFVMFLV